MKKGCSHKLRLRKHLAEIAKQLKWGFSLEKDAFLFYYVVGVFITIMILVEDNLPFGFKGELFSQVLASYIVYGSFLVFLFMLLVLILLRFIAPKKYRGRLYRLSRLLTMKLWQLALPAIFVFLGVSTVCLIMWGCFSLPHYKKYAIDFLMYPIFLVLFLCIGQFLCVFRFLNKRDNSSQYLLIALVFVFFPLLITFKGKHTDTTIKLDKITYEKLMELSGRQPEEYLQKVIQNP
ncbi:hypothetical protein AAEU41_05325 [Pantoea agglomerans]